MAPKRRKLQEVSRAEAEPVVRANGHTCHDPCYRTARAKCVRGSPLTLGKTMKALLGFLLLATGAFAEPATVRFDGRDLLRVDNPEEEAAGIRVYRDKAAGLPTYELGLVRIQNAPGDWPTIRESLLSMIRKKASLLAAVVREDSDDGFVVVDFACLRPDGVTFEYTILRGSLNAKHELVTVDVRLRFPVARKDLVARVERNRDELASEFTRLAKGLVR
jgi:hypothetical protein